MAISPLFEDDFAPAQDPDLFLSGFDTNINNILNPNPIPGVGDSELASEFGQAPTPLFSQNALKKVNAAGGSSDDLSKQNLASQNKELQKAISAVAPLSAGLSAGNQVSPTPNAAEAVTSVGVSTLAGAASGALTGAAIGAAGGPIGAVGGAVIGGLSALVVGGTKAWFGTRSARRKNRALKELQRKAEKQRAQDIARNEKWARINSFNNLQIAEDNRAQTLLQNKWSNYQNVASQMTNLMNSDANLNNILSQQMRGLA